MVEYFTKREYNQMHKALSMKIKSLETKNAKLEAEVKKLKTDYNVLLEVSNEKVED